MSKRLSAYPHVDDHIGLRIYCPRCSESRDTHIQDQADFPAEQDFTGGNLLNAQCGHCGAMFGVCADCGWTTGVPGLFCVNGHNPMPEPEQEPEPELSKKETVAA